MTRGATVSHRDSEGQAKCGGISNDNKDLGAVLQANWQKNTEGIEWVSARSESETSNALRLRRWNRHVGSARRTPHPQEPGRCLREAIGPPSMQRCVPCQPAPGDSSNQSPTRKDRSKTRRQSPPVSRILFNALSGVAAIIPLGRRSPAGSSHLPATSPSRIIGRLFGVAPRRDCPFHPN